MSQKPLPIAAFDEILNSIRVFVTMSADIDPIVEEAAIKAEQAFHRLSDLILFGLYNDVPPNRQEFFQRHTLNAAIESLVKYAKEHEKGPWGDYVCALSTSILALNWIAAERNPSTIVADMTEASAYYSDRVRRTKREHRVWATKWHQVLTELLNYVRSHFLTGFTWGALRASQAAVPPPPPPPPEVAGTSRREEFRNEEAGQGDPARRRLLHDLNVGTDITRRLRPTPAPRREENERPVQPQPVPEVQAAPRAANLQGANARPPRLELDGRKWVVENQQNQQGMKIENNSMSESVSMFRCENSSLEVADKINSVVIDNCNRSSVLIRGVVGSVALVRCSRINIQFAGPVPLINIDNCDSIQIFIEEASKNAIVISSQSTSLNICILKDDGDYVELPVPEQIRTEIQGQQLRSTVYENRG